MKNLIRSLLVVPFLTSCIRVHHIPIARQAGDHRVGIDALGLAKHNAKVLKDEMPAESALGFLDETFGDPYEKATEILKSGKVKAVRIHLIDGTCIRNRVCPRGAPTYTSYRELERRAKRAYRWCTENSVAECYVSPFLEHDEKNKAVVDRWYNILRSTAPGLKYVCSAFTGYCPDAVLIERHGARRGAIASPDGISHADLDSIAYRDNGKLITFSWLPENNGRVTGEEGFIMPKLRVNWPTRADIRHQVRMLAPADPMPVVPGCQPIKAPELFKTRAEYYGKGHDDGRGNKGLFISKTRMSKVKITTLKGKEVGYLGYYGTFSGTPGTYRHYIGGGRGSGQKPVRLRRLLGGDWGLLKGGGKCWIFSPIHRQGYFR